MVPVRWTEFAEVVRRFGDFLVIWRGEIIKTYPTRDRDKAKSYARGWNAIDKDKGKYFSQGAKKGKKGDEDDEG